MRPVMRKTFYIYAKTKEIFAYMQKQMCRSAAAARAADQCLKDVFAA